MSELQENGTGDRTLVAGLAALLLVAVLLTVLTIAKHEALRDQVRVACDTAAALDLVAFNRLCHDVGYQQTTS